MKQRLFNVAMIRIFLSFLYRDFYIYCKHLKDDIVNYMIIYPVLGSINFGYLQSNIYFGNQNSQFAVMYLSGYVLLILMIVTFKKIVALLFDLQEHHFIDYQMTIMPARLILCERLIAASTVTFILISPFFIIAKLLLGTQLNTAQSHWPMVFGMLLLSSFMCTAYHLLACCMLKVNQLSTLWARFNNPLITLGGFWAPWYIITMFSPVLGSLMYLNPLLYVTEGLRQALIRNTQFFSLTQSIVGLLGATITFMLICFIVFKRRVDHI